MLLLAATEGSTASNWLTREWTSAKMNILAKGVLSEEQTYEQARSAVESLIRFLCCVAKHKNNGKPTVLDVSLLSTHVEIEFDFPCNASPSEPLIDKLESPLVRGSLRPGGTFRAFVDYLIRAAATKNGRYAVSIANLYATGNTTKVEVIPWP